MRNRTLGHRAFLSIFALALSLLVVPSHMDMAKANPGDYTFNAGPGWVHGSETILITYHDQQPTTITSLSFDNPDFTIYDNTCMGSGLTSSPVITTGSTCLIKVSFIPQSASSPIPVNSPPSESATLSLMDQATGNTYTDSNDFQNVYIGAIDAPNSGYTDVTFPFTAVGDVSEVTYAVHYVTNATAWYYDPSQVSDPSCDPTDPTSPGYNPSSVINIPCGVDPTQVTLSSFTFTTAAYGGPDFWTVAGSPGEMTIGFDSCYANGATVYADQTCFVQFVFRPLDTSLKAAQDNQVVSFTQNYFSDQSATLPPPYYDAFSLSGNLFSVTGPTTPVSTQVNQTSADIPVTITNNQAYLNNLPGNDGGISFQNFHVPTNYTIDSATSGNCSYVIGTSTCTINLQFSPTSVGDVNGLFSFQDSSGNNYYISIPSTGTPIPISADITTLDPVVGSAPVTTIADNGQFSATVSWYPNDPVFLANTYYEATLIITPDANYTSNGESITFDGQLAMTDSQGAGGAPAVVTTPPFPAAFFSASSVTFDPVAIAGQATQTVIITNNGNANLLINGAISIDDSTDFSITNDLCSGTTLSPTVVSGNGGTCTFTLIFQPTVNTQLNATISVPDNVQNPDTISVVANLPPFFTISNFAESGIVGTPITGYSINSTGSPITSYSISPDISVSPQNGIIFDPQTGLISGTPISAATSVTYTITGSNPAGSQTATYVLQVSGTPPTTYTVHFDSNGHGNAYADATGVTTLLHSSFPVESASGYNFLGWSLTSNGSVISGDYTPISDGTTLYAIWQLIPPTTYTIHFNSNGHGTSVSDLTGITTLLHSSFPTNSAAGYTFQGWSLTSNGSVISGDYTPLSDGTTLYAIWQLIPPTTYTVHFNSNGHGTAVSDLTGITTLLHSSFPSEAAVGYNFVGWSLTSNGSVIQGDYTPVSDGTTLYAIWQVIPPTTYTIHFNSNGHGTSVSDLTGIATLVHASFPSESDAGYTFQGWSLTSNGSVISGDYTPVSDGTTLYAIWQLIPTPPAPSAPALPPSQRSSISSISPSSGIAGVATQVLVSGTFVETIASITLNSVPLPVGSWIQRSTSVTITIPASVAGTYSIQIYNGAFPFMATQAFRVVVPTPTPTPTPSPTPTPTPSPISSPTPVATPSPIPSTSPTPKPSSTPTPTRSPSASPSSTPTPTPSPSHTGPLSASLSLKVYFGLGSFALDSKNTATLKSFASQLVGLGSTITISVRGFAQPTPGTEATDLVLSKQRAATVAQALRKYGVTTRVVYKGAGRALVNQASSRYVDIVAENA